MKLRKKVSILLFLLGLIFLIAGAEFSLTGNFVRNYFSSNFIWTHILGFVFLIGGFLLFVEKKSLDYLLMPEGSEKMREQRDYSTMEELIKRHGKVKEIYMMNGKDSEEDILYLGKLLKGGERIGLVTFPEHYKEYKELIKKAKRDGKFPKFVKVKHINTRKPAKNFGEAWYNFKERVYGRLGLWEEKLKKRKLDYKENRNEKGLEKIKSFVHRVLKI